MKIKSKPQIVDPPEAQQQTRPSQSVTLASGKTLERAPAAASQIHERPERGNDRYYTKHWGINE